MIEVVHIAVVMKPLDKQNFAEAACGQSVSGLNVDECRIPADWKTDSGTRWGHSHKRTTENVILFGGAGQMHSKPNDGGRFPANVIHDGSEEVLVVFPRCKVGGHGVTKENYAGYTMSGPASSKTRATIGYADDGSASRFFKECSWIED